MARQMRGMTDKQVKVMMKLATTAQKGARAVSRVKAFMSSRAALLIALAVLVLAFVLQWTGVM